MVSKDRDLDKKIKLEFSSKAEWKEFFNEFEKRLKEKSDRIKQIYYLNRFYYAIVAYIYIKITYFYNKIEEYDITIHLNNDINDDIEDYNEIYYYDYDLMNLFSELAFEEQKKRIMKKYNISEDDVDVDGCLEGADVIFTYKNRKYRSLKEIYNFRRDADWNVVENIFYFVPKPKRDY